MVAQETVEVRLLGVLQAVVTGFRGEFFDFRAYFCVLIHVDRIQQ